MADGRFLDKEAMVAAHRTLPLGTEVRVWRGERYVELIIADRGPYVAGRSIDLSEGAARALGMIHEGVVPITIEVISVPERSETYHHKNRACLKQA
jgi:rare lipoprotein A